MAKLASLFAIVFLAVFTVSATVQAVSANAMALNMSMADCQGCLEDGDSGPSGAACKLVCTAPVIAFLN